MSKKSKRVLLFTTAYKPFVGGSEMAIENISRRLPSIFFDILTPRHTRGLEKTARDRNFCLHRLGFGWRADKYLFPVLGFFKALRLMRENDYRLIHAYQASQGAGAAWLLKLFKPKIKFILTIQEGKDLNRQSFWLKFFRNLIIRKADIISGISHYLADYAKMLNRKAKIVVIPNGVDLDKFSPRNAENSESGWLKEKLGLKEDSRLIITASRLVAKNDVGSLVKSMVKVRAWLPEAKLLIVGQGPLDETLKNQTRELNLDDAVLFLGEVNHDVLPKYLKIADVFVRPSRSEGLGSSFLEAMAVGLPVIGTPVGGIPDFLIDGQTGLFCKVSDPDNLAQKIIEILTNRRLRVSLVNNAQTLIREKYNWEIIARKFADLYSYGI